MSSRRSSSALPHFGVADGHAALDEQPSRPVSAGAKRELLAGAKLFLRLTQNKENLRSVPAS